MKINYWKTCIVCGKDFFQRKAYRNLCLPCCVEEVKKVQLKPIKYDILIVDDLVKGEYNETN